MSDLKTFNGAITNIRTQEYVKQILGERAGQFIANVTSVVANDSKLQACEPYTLMFAALKATSLGLPIDQNLGFAYIIPYKNNKEGKTEAQFQLGYKGISQLAIRSGQFKTINVTDVREGELVSRDRRTGELKFQWVDNDEERNKLPIIGYLGYFRLLNGYEKETYWTIEELKAHGLRYSQTFASKNDYVRNSSKWTTDFDAMCKKTVIKLMLNKGDAPLSPEMQTAILADQAVIRGNLDGTETIDYVDNNQKAVGQSTATFPKIGETQPQPIEEAQAQVVEEQAETKETLFD